MLFRSDQEDNLDDDQGKDLAAEDEEEEVEVLVLKYDVVEFLEGKEIAKLLGKMENMEIDTSYYDLDPDRPIEEHIPQFIVSDNGNEYPVNSLREAVDRIKNAGSRGISIQRYKGLGEMNPDQLWETTMNPKSRRLLKVAIEDSVQAEEMFTTLMGEHVLPRRKFIQKHAPEVRNLDV